MKKGDNRKMFSTSLFVPFVSGLLSVYQPVIAVLSPRPPDRKECTSIVSHCGYIFLSKSSNLPVQLLDCGKTCCSSDSLFPVTCPPLRVREFCDLAVTLMWYIVS